MSTLCVDLGATKTLIGILDRDFKVIRKKKTVNFLQNIENELRDLIKKS